MRDEQMDGGSNSPMCSSDRTVRKYRDRKLGCAAQDMMMVNQLLG